MKKEKILLLSILMIVLSTGCQNICDCFKSAGEIVTQERNLAPVSFIQLENDPNLIVHSDSVFRMRVSAGSKLIDKITTEVVDGKLTIKNRNKCNWVRKFKPEMTVEVWLPTLQNLYIYNATGSVHFLDTLHTTDFYLESFGSFGDYYILLNSKYASIKLNTGPANAYVYGVTDQNIIFNAGFGINDCKSLQSNYVFIRSRGTNNSLVHAMQTLDASLESSGNIYYRGNPPEIHRKEIGTGKILPLIE